EIAAPKISANRAADEPRALAEDGDRVGVLVGLREQRLLRYAALVPQGLHLPRVNPMPFALEALLHDAREGEVHVVAAEQNVIADGDALERKVAILFPDEDQ